MPGTPQHNGKAEAFNKTVKTLIKAELSRRGHTEEEVEAAIRDVLRHYNYKSHHTTTGFIPVKLYIEPSDEDKQKAEDNYRRRWKFKNNVLEIGDEVFLKKSSYVVVKPDK